MTVADPTGSQSFTAARVTGWARWGSILPESSATAVRPFTVPVTPEAEIEALMHAARSMR